MFVSAIAMGAMRLWHLEPLLEVVATGARCNCQQEKKILSSIDQERDEVKRLKV
jgi:hypothetical protein